MSLIKGKFSYFIRFRPAIAVEDVRTKDSSNASAGRPASDGASFMALLVLAAALDSPVGPFKCV